MSFTAGAGTRFLVSTGASGTTPLSGPLSITGGTVTANNPVLSATQTWNNAAVTFTGWRLNITDTASNAASLLMDLQVGGSSRFYVNKAGTIANDLALGSIQINPGGTNSIVLRGAGADWGLEVFSNASVNVRSTVPFGWATATYTTPDLQLWRDAANTLAQRNGVNAQTLRVYNTFTDASNYERGRFAWVSNILTIGTENAGTGLARELELQTNGTSRIFIGASGGVGIGIAPGAQTLRVAQNLSLIQAGYNPIGIEVNTLNSIVGFHVKNFFTGLGIASFAESAPAGTFRIDGNGNVVCNNAAIATNAVNGFLYVPGCAGLPTGTPTAYTGRVPIVVDTTNNKLYFYSGGAWRDAGP